MRGRDEDGTYTTTLKQITDFKGKSFLKTSDFSKDELETLIDFAMELKEKKQHQLPHPYLKGKNIALLFEKPSTRTRAAFSVAAKDLGANVDVYGEGDFHLGVKESIADTAKVFGRMYDGIEFRGFKQAHVETLSVASGVPVWNGLTNEWHPTQMIADFMTLKEHFGTLKNKTLTYVGDASNNVAHDLLVTGAILGVHIHIAAPLSAQPDPSVQELAQQLAKHSGANLRITENIEEAVKHTDAIYTDVWLSMGTDDAEWEQRIEALLPYQVNSDLLNLAQNPNAIVMHCLPAFHDVETFTAQKIQELYGLEAMEITDDVFQSAQSVVFEQAENRLHSIKAIIAATLGDVF
ncbi:ornithine carbamoyltransferase [Staphylococcus chromogenes]|uniref:ornithine carbamoyltransferase n=1 Tax=Staphylococcus chromogenes TaxID=46126 RepID=UPI0021CF4AA2|nr:ornithine carbamoyltransferase [Staphylococcus chromogenes]UXS68889.1 ornithine carbamoyltransferase [Staphylococcus chromogenes]